MLLFYIISERQANSCPLARARYWIKIAKIIRQVTLAEDDLQTFVLGELGITPIWYREYAELPKIIDEILK